MPLLRAHYLDLTAEQRRAGAKQARANLKSSLANPHLTPDQRAQLQGQLKRIDRWEAGTLHEPSPPPKTASDNFTAKDAIEMGLCEQGVLDWFKEHSLDPNVGAPLSVLQNDEDRRARAAGLITERRRSRQK